MPETVLDVAVCGGEKYQIVVLARGHWQKFKEYFKGLEPEVLSTFDPFGGDYSVKRIRKAYDDFVTGDGFCLAVTDSAGRIGGLAWLGSRTQRRPGFGLGLRLDYQGCGLGRRLMETCIAEARKRFNIDGIWLTVVKANYRALSLYQSLGFRMLAECTCRHRFDSYVMGVWFRNPPAWWNPDFSKEGLAGRRIFLVPYTHCDWAWCYTRQWHEARYAHVLQQVLDAIRDNPELRWFIDAASEQFDALERWAPDRVPELRKRIAEGSIGVSGGMISICHPHRVDGETFIRNLVLGRRFFEKRFKNLELDTAVFYDVIGGHSQLPQLLSKAGYRFYRISRPEGFMFLRGVPALFRWKGLDRTELLTSIGHYDGFASASATALNDWRTDWPKAEDYFVNAELKRRVPAFPGPHVWIPVGCDDQFPLRTHGGEDVDLLGFVREWNRRGAPPVRFATPSEFVSAVWPKRRQLPTWSGPLEIAGWSHWYGQIGHDSLWRIRPSAEQALLDAETLSALSDRVGHLPRSDALWWDYLATCAHATLWLFEQDYEEMLARLRAVVTEARRVADEKRRSMARKHLRLRPGRDVIVWNRLSWDVTGPVRVNVTFPEPGVQGTSLAVADGTLLPCQLAAVRRYPDGSLKEADLVAECKVTGLGALALTVKDDDQAAPTMQECGESVENEFLKIQFGEGGILRIHDKTDSQDYVDQGFLRFYHTPDRDRYPLLYAPTVGIDRFEQTGFEVVEHGELFTEVTLTGRVGEHEVENRAIVNHTRPLVEFETTIEAVGGDGDFRVGFPLPYAGKLHAGIPFGAEERDVESEYYGDSDARFAANIERFEEGVFWAMNWADFSDGKKGVAVFVEPGMQGFRYVARARLLEHFLHKVVSHAKQGWMRHMHRCREGKGRQRFRYALLFHAGDWRDARLDRRALEWAHRPSAQVWADGTTRGSGTSWRPLRIESDHARLSAVYRDRNEIIIRVIETLGKKGDVVLKHPWGRAPVRLTDFLGNSVPRKLRCGRDSVRFRLSAWEIATLCVRTK